MNYDFTLRRTTTGYEFQSGQTNGDSAGATVVKY